MLYIKINLGRSNSDFHLGAKTSDFKEHSFLTICSCQIKWSRQTNKTSQMSFVLLFINEQWISWNYWRCGAILMWSNCNNTWHVNNVIWLDLNFDACTECQLLMYKRVCNILRLVVVPVWSWPASGPCVGSTSPAPWSSVNIQLIMTLMTWKISH